MEAIQQKRILLIAEANQNQFETPEAHALADVFQEYGDKVIYLWREAGIEAGFMNQWRHPDSWTEQGRKLFQALEEAYRETTHWFEGMDSKPVLALPSLRNQVISTLPVNARYSTTQAYHYSIAACEKTTDYLEAHEMRIPIGAEVEEDPHWRKFAEICFALVNKFQHLRNGALQHNPNIIVYILQTVGTINTDLASIDWNIRMPHSGQVYQVVKK